jgi:hypothetical protein
MTHGAMHNPGRPVRGGPAGDLSASKDFPNIVLDVPRWEEESMDNSLSPARVHSPDCLRLAKYLQLHLFHIWPVSPPKTTSGSAHFTLRSCTHRRYLLSESGLYHRNPVLTPPPTMQKEKTRATPPDLHGHLLLPRTTPILPETISRS